MDARLDAAIPIAEPSSVPEIRSDAGAGLVLGDAAVDAPKTAVVPSAGCRLGEASPAVAFASDSAITVVELPESYDGTTAQPLVLGFHTTNAPLDLSGLAESYVVAAPKAQNHLSTWEDLLVFPEVFTELYAELQAEYCFDESRVYGIGHGSGSRYLAGTYRRRPEVFRALAIHGAANWRDFSAMPAIPILFLHSDYDLFSDTYYDDADGMRSLEALVSTNGCQTDRSPEQSGSCGSEPTSFECTDYAGCSQQLRFCRHDTPSGGIDLWACYADDEIASFFGNDP